MTKMKTKKIIAIASAVILAVSSLAGCGGNNKKVEEGNMCLICDRIQQIKNGTNPYFVKELEPAFKARFLEEMSLAAEAAYHAFGAER